MENPSLMVISAISLITHQLPPFDAVILCLSDSPTSRALGHWNAKSTGHSTNLETRSTPQRCSIEASLAPESRPFPFPGSAAPSPLSHRAFGNDPSPSSRDQEFPGRTSDKEPPCPNHVDGAVFRLGVFPDCGRSRLLYSFATVPLFALATQILAPSKPMPKGDEPTLNVPSRVPSLARSLVTLSLP